MLIYGLCFILYFIKLSGTTGYPNRRQNLIKKNIVCRSIFQLQIFFQSPLATRQVEAEALEAGEASQSTIDNEYATASTSQNLIIFSEEDVTTSKSQDINNEEGVTTSKSQDISNNENLTTSAPKDLIIINDEDESTCSSIDNETAKASEELSQHGDDGLPKRLEELMKRNEELVKKNKEYVEREKEVTDSFKRWSF